MKKKEKNKLYVNCPRCGNIIYESRFYPRVEMGKKIKCQYCKTIFIAKGHQNGMKCNVCGKIKEDNFEDTDPFLEEVEPKTENPILSWCEECYKEREDTI